MEIRHLEYFIEVARYKNFSKAAAAVHVSQPSISKAIKELEEELGKPLFSRTTKHVYLSEAGEAILKEVEDIVYSFRNINTMLRDNEQLEEGKIHIGIPPITAITSFGRMLISFKNNYPKIKIQLFEYGPKKIESSLQDGLIDIGIFTPEDRDPFERLWFETDLHDVVMHASHPLAQYKKIDYIQLHRENLVIYNSDYKLHDMIISGCVNAGFIPNVTFETIQIELMWQMVLAQIGIAILPQKTTKKLPPSLVAIPLNDPDLCLHLALTWSKDRSLSVSANKFIDFVKNEFELKSK